MVAQVATQLADSFIKWDLGARERQATETSRFLETQLAEAKKEMDAQDAKLSEFKTEHRGELPDPAFGGALTRLQSKMQTTADALNRLDGEKLLLLHSGEAETAATATGKKSERHRLMEEQTKLEERLANLRSRYSDEHPDVVQAQLELENIAKQVHSTPEETPEAGPSSTPGRARIELLTREIGRRQEEQNKS